MNVQKSFKAPGHSRKFAFGLVEVTIAMGLVAFVMLALVGLAGRAMVSSRESKERVAASNVAVSILQGWATNPKAPPGQLPIDAMDPASVAVGGSVERNDILIDQNGEETASEQNATFRLKYRISRPANAPNQVLVWLHVSWPAAAGSGSSNVSSYELLHSIQI
jgi:uncharacterized protein (TIGR02598 family)